MDGKNSVYLEQYQSVLLQCSATERILWRFTQMGRARLNLWKAQKMPDNQRRIKSLQQSVKKLYGWKKAGEPETHSLISEILLFLGWLALQRNQFDEAAQWMLNLDKDFPELLARLSLRWELMNRLLQNKKHKHYSAQAKLFLADPCVGFDPSCVCSPQLFGW
jgi:hypothetical protein